jgi:hypothetical protein
MSRVRLICPVCSQALVFSKEDLDKGKCKCHKCGKWGFIGVPTRSALEANTQKTASLMPSLLGLATLFLVLWVVFGGESEEDKSAKERVHSQCIASYAAVGTGVVTQRIRDHCNGLDFWTGE